MRKSKYDSVKVSMEFDKDYSVIYFIEYYKDKQLIKRKRTADMDLINSVLWDHTNGNPNTKHKTNLKNLKVTSERSKLTTAKLKKVIPAIVITASLGILKTISIVSDSFLSQQIDNENYYKKNIYHDSLASEPKFNLQKIYSLNHTLISLEKLMNQKEKMDPTTNATVNLNLNTSTGEIIFTKMEKHITKSNITITYISQVMNIDLIETESLMNLYNMLMEIHGQAVVQEPEFVQEELEIIPEGEHQIFLSRAYTITEEEKIKAAAIIAGEDSYSYEGALASWTTVLNRCDTEKWQCFGGKDPYQQLTYSGQFTAVEGKLTNYYLNSPEEIPDHVIQAIEDGLNGYRNHEFTEFRANKASNRVQIGEKGNWYYGKSDTIPNYGYVTTEKVKIK